MNKIKDVLTFLLLFINFGIFGQQRLVSLFNPGDKIVFLGNSITYGGDFYYNDLLYYVTRNPGIPLYFYDCGISGDRTTGILKRIDVDVLNRYPNYVVIEIGMNDIERNLYKKTNHVSSDTLSLRMKFLNLYKKNLDSIVKIFLSRNVKVILQKPTIYDQTAIMATVNNYGANDALKECADYIQILADKYHLVTVDYWSILNNINHQLQKKDSTATIIGTDRVHPGPTGNFIMTYQFLKNTGSYSQYVSKFQIDLYKKELDTINCNIFNLNINSREMSFNCIEHSLPFPVRDDQLPALDLVPFTNEMNQEICIIKNLKPSKYKLYIDTFFINTYSNIELSEGINLSEIKTTPQYRQALSLQKTISSIRNREFNLRLIKYVEYYVLHNYAMKLPVEKTKQILDSIYRVRNYEKTLPYFKIMIEKYVNFKPQEKQTDMETETLRHVLYENNKPKLHIFKLIKQ